MHLLLVGGFYPALYDLAKLEMSIEGVVLVGNLLCLTVSDTNEEYLVGAGHRVTLCQQLLAIGMNAKQNEVCLLVGNLLNLALQIGAIQVGLAMPYTREIQSVVVACPCKLVHTTFKGFCDISLLASCKFIDAKACTVALISVALHAAPCNELAVGRELGILVITGIYILLELVHGLILERTSGVASRTHIAFGLAEVLCFSALKVV